MTQAEGPHQTGREEPARRPARPTRQNPLCYLIDREPGIRRMITSLLVSYGIGTKAFDSLADMPGGDPDLVVVDVTTNASDALTLIDQLAAAPIACAVQLLSGLNPVLVEQIRRHGAQSGLQMLPVLQKPLQSGALHRIVTDLGLRRDPHAAMRFDLEEILANDWLETWYQPTIDLKQRKLVGAEAFVRARHPQHGVVTPELFLPQAGERALVEMTRRMLGRALQDWPAF